MKGVPRGGASISSVKGVSVMNVRESFGLEEVCMGREVNRCVCVKSECQGVEVKTLLDSGCPVNLVFKNAFEKMPGITKENVANSYIKGLGATPVTVIAKFKTSITIAGMRMEEDVFYIIDRVSEKHDLLLGYKFMNKNRMILDPQHEMIEIRRGENARNQLYVSKDGSVKVRMLYGIGIFATENVRLPRENFSIISVKVGWQGGFGVGEGRQNEIFMMDGSTATYKVRRLAHVFDGILDMDDPRVCLQVWANPGRKRWRGVNVGDKLGEMYTVVDVDDERYMKGFSVMSGCLRQNEWEFERLKEEVKLGDHLSEKEKERVYTMLWNRRKTLSRGDEDIGHSKLPEFKIILRDETPIYQRPRHFPPPITSEIEAQCEELERVGVIEPSESEWNSPIVPVRKPDGKLRMCIDYRRVNEVTVKDRFPMRVISECVYSMNGMKVFTKMDLVRGYYQMPIAEESRPVTAFSTTKKHYQFRNLSFGLANAPAAFQRAMNTVLSEFPKEKVLVFIDDILIVSESVEEHMELVDAVLRKLEEVGVKVKISKCEWFEREVEFLGHKVSETGIRKSEKFIKKVREFPKPRTVRELKGFLGLIEFGRKFTEDCSGIAKPLTEWTGKRKSVVLKWDERMENAFMKLKENVVKDVELAYPDYSPNARVLEVYTDASGISMGGCLMQDQVVNGVEQKRVIAYVSKAFSKAERKYSTIERELAALRHCVKTLKPFLFGVRFIIKTDHQPLVYLKRMRMVDSRLARTVEDLSDFDYVLEYVPGERNVIADLMSRMPEGINESEVKSVSPGYLPKGLKVGMEVKGGGDSLFDSVLVGLKDLKRDGLPVSVPDGVNELRTIVMNEACKRPEQLGIKDVRKYMKELRAMSFPGIMPFQEILIIVSELFKTLIYVHFGMTKPIIYRAKNLKESKYVLHLQWLGEVHYNYVIETKYYDRVDIEDDDVNENECEIDFVMEVEEPVEVCVCKHGNIGGMTVVLQVNDKRYCGLIDTGAQISLVNASVVREEERQSWILSRRSVNVNIHGIGEGCVIAWEEVGLTVSIGKLMNVSHKFAVLNEEQMPYCFLIGIDFLRLKGLVVDLGNERLLKNDMVIAQMQSDEFCLISFVGRVWVDENETMSSEEVNENECVLNENEKFLEKNDEDLLSSEDIERMQQDCPIISQLRECIMNGVPVSEWRGLLMYFKRFANKFVISSGLIYFKREWMNEEMYVPVFSISGAIGVCMLVHERLGHMGKIKLWECMRERMFTPFLGRICTDVATTCEACQKGKYQRKYVSPPVLKLCMNVPFEMVTIDCVSFPRSSRGNVGLIVMVDHKSKFAYAACVKNKTSENVAEIVSERLLPMCVCKPEKMLSDNGPEFVGRAFERMLNEWGVEHLYTTPYNPSANGLAERTIRTLSEILRMMNERVNDWDLYVGKALWVYNMTVHKGIGMSPCEYVLNFERYIKPRLRLSENERELWRKANEKFESFKVGEKVLKEVITKGRLNVNKMKEKFEGPLIVKKVWSNGLSYLLECMDERGCISEVRAHHNQLRKWREPPEYLKIHPMNDWLRENRLIEVEEDDRSILKDKQLVLVEERRRSKRKSVKKDRKIEVDSNRTVEDLGQLPNEITYSVSRFPLHGERSQETRDEESNKREDNETVEKIEIQANIQEPLEISEGSPYATENEVNGKDSIDSGEIQEIEKWLEEIWTDSSKGSFYGFPSREIQRHRNLEIRECQEENVEQVEVENQLECEESERIRVSEVPEISKNEKSERRVQYTGPTTRSRGPVSEYEWVIKKGV